MIDTNTFKCQLSIHSRQDTWRGSFKNSIILPELDWKSGLALGGWADGWEVGGGRSPMLGNSPPPLGVGGPGGGKSPGPPGPPCIGGSGWSMLGGGGPPARKDSHVKNLICSHYLLAARSTARANFHLYRKTIICLIVKRKKRCSKVASTLERCQLQYKV